VALHKKQVDTTHALRHLLESWVQQILRLLGELENHTLTPLVVVQKILDANLASGYIRQRESEYVSYVRLNKVTLKDNYTIPLIDDLLERLANKKLFSKLDLKNGFHHVFMD